MTELRPLLTILVAALFLGLALVGCSDSQRPRSILEVVSTNQNSALQSDVVHLDSDGSPTVMEDEVEIRIKSNPHDGALDLTNGPFGYVTLDNYEIRFDSSEQIPGVSGSLGWTVHTGETISGSLVVVPGALKIEPPLISLSHGGEILATAHIRIFGREANSNYPVTVETTLAVNFANWADK
jgi:hypothetical protein